MEEISFDLGLISYKIGGVEVKFNPTDLYFAERIYNTFAKLEKKQEEYKAEAKRVSGNEIETFNVARKWDIEMRSMIDEAIGEGFCSKLFGYLNVYAFNGDGIPLWAAFLMIIIKKINEKNKDIDIKAEEAFSKYAEKYTAKYHK